MSFVLVPPLVAPLAALVRRGGAASAFALRRAARDPDQAVGRHVVDLVRRLGKAELAVLVLVAGLREGAFPDRRRTAAALGRAGHRGGIASLAAAQKDAAKRSVCACHGRRRPRAHVAVVTQTAYLARLSSEVA